MISRGVIFPSFQNKLALLLRRSGEDDKPHYDQIPNYAVLDSLSSIISAIYLRLCKNAKKAVCTPNESCPKKPYNFLNLSINPHLSLKSFSHLFSPQKLHKTPLFRPFPPFSPPWRTASYDAVKRPLLGIWYNKPSYRKEQTSAVKRPLLGIWYNLRAYQRPNIHAVKRPLLGIWYNLAPRGSGWCTAVKRPLLGIWYNRAVAQEIARPAVKRPLLGIWYNSA